MDPISCTYDTAKFLIFSENVFSPLIYYSHLVPAITSSLLGIFILLSNKKNLVNKTFFFVTTIFTLWIFIDLILWANEKTELIMFFWSIIVPIEMLLYIGCLYFVSVFERKGDDVSFGSKFLIFLTFVPFFLFTHTKLNLIGFDATNCEREAIEGPLVQYLYFMELFYILWIARIGYGNKKTLSVSDTNQLRIVTSGVLIFLFIFSMGNILVSYFLEVDWAYEQYKLFGMPILAGFIAYTSVKFRTFDFKVLTAQILIITLSILTFSILFLKSIKVVHVIAIITFIFVSIIGYFLIKSVKKEIEQREKIEHLAKQLQDANDQLKVLDKMKSEFVSIASHQLRGPLTSIRGYASMLAEGSYGKFPQKATEVLEKIADSAKFMALSVEDYLNVSRIEAGNMKYELADFNVKELTEKVVDEVRPVAIKKGLVMVFRSDCSGSCLTHADIGKSRQIIMNLIDNSMKYTPKGTITTVVHDDLRKKKLYIKIQDTGVGMSKETQEEVFDKFVRAKNANQVNVTGTGLGLYVAKKMITEMGGRVWAESEGEGKGSTFTIEFPILPGKSMR